MWRLMFDFARTTTNIAPASASSAAFFTLADWNTYDGFFASATTCKAGNRSLAVAFRTQCFIWHLCLSYFESGDVRSVVTSFTT